MRLKAGKREKQSKKQSKEKRLQNTVKRGKVTRKQKLRVIKKELWRKGRGASMNWKTMGRTARK